MTRDTAWPIATLQEAALFGVFQRAGIVDRYEALSQRKREVFQLVAEGHSTRMSPMLSISVATVEGHRAHPSTLWCAFYTKNQVFGR